MKIDWSAKLKRLKLCIATLQGYPQFTPGQDGYAALQELDSFINHDLQSILEAGETGDHSLLAIDSRTAKKQVY